MIKDNIVSVVNGRVIVIEAKGEPRCLIELRSDKT